MRHHCNSDLIQYEYTNCPNGLLNQFGQLVFALGQMPNGEKLATRNQTRFTLAELTLGHRCIL